MKKQLLLLFALLTYMGGVNYIKAENYKVYSSAIGAHEKNGNCEFDAETNTFSWTASTNCTADLFYFEAGVLAQFSTLHVTCSDLTTGGGFRVLIGDGTNWTTKYYGNAGDFDIALSELSAEKLAAATQIRIGGRRSKVEGLRSKV